MHLIYFHQHSRAVGTVLASYWCGYVTQEEAYPPIDLHTSSAGWLRHIQEVEIQKQDNWEFFFFTKLP